MEQLLSYVLIIGAALSVYAGISRWIFKINDRTENQEIIIQMLGQLLIQHGLTEDEVRKILNRKSKK